MTSRTLTFFCSWFVCVSSLSAADAKLLLKVTDKSSGKPIPCRVHLTDEAGKAHRPADLPFWRDHFVCAGAAELSLPTGRYHFEIERGPEWIAVRGDAPIEKGEQKLNVELRRFVDLRKEGWWSGDLHVHRPVKDVPLLMQAEDLHVAPVITWWNNRNEWKQPKRIPDKLLVRFDDDRFYHLMAGEDERGGGALLYFNLSKPLPIAGSQREHPSSLKFLHEARKHKGVHVDVEKPFWWDVPLWVATGAVDSIGLANNHMCRDRMYESEAWGKPRDVKRLPPPRGNGYWTQEIYYHLLNSGLRIPPSAGSASGVLPNPVGYNRVYVHVDGDFTYEKWWSGLKAGRSFVTNGPLLRVRVNGKLPGHVFKAAADNEVELAVSAKLTTRDPIESLEIIKNGKVVRSVSVEELRKTGSLKSVQFKESGWLLVRAIAQNRKTFRFASTAPFYVEIGARKHTINKESVQFFLDWIDARERQLMKLTNAEQRAAVLKHAAQARKFWADRK